MTYRLGVDVGGTFTDVLLIDEQTGITHRAKTASTPQDQSVGVLNGIRKACRDACVELSEITQVTHGTTAATNAILEERGAAVGLLTTRGFRDMLQIGRSYVPGGLAGWIVWPKPEPLAHLEHTAEVSGRVDASGTVVEEMDLEDARAQMRGLAASGIQALTISLINSYANDAHEQLLGEIAREELPDIPVSLASQVLPEMREYERTVTTVANSYVQPEVSSYIGNLSSRLKEEGIQAPLSMLRSDGGLASAGVAARSPVSMLLSGPAGGVSGAVWFAEQAGHHNFLTFDMGGTSSDVALVVDGQPKIGRETSVGDLTVRSTSVDVRTVGAGGGSVAHVPDLTKALRVGPHSAGADPGPAAYGKAGELATVTDANVVLGYLPSELADGEIALDVDASRVAVGTVAESVGLDSVEEAAAGIIDIVNENMFGALRLVSVQQGFDPREFALVSFGGAGPLHANALGKLTGAWPVIVPPSPGVLCAYGDATTSARCENAQTFMRDMSRLKDAELREALNEMAATASAELLEEGVQQADQRMRYELDVRYQGQGFEIPVTITEDTVGATDLVSQIGTIFDEEHRRLFSFLLPNAREIINIRVTAVARRPDVTWRALPDGGTSATDALMNHNSIWVDGGWAEAGIYDRTKLHADNIVSGPAIVTEMDSTTLVLPGHSATVHTNGNLLIQPTEV